MKKTNDNESKNQSKVIIVPKPPKGGKDTTATKTVVQDVLKSGKDVVKELPAQPKEK